jgi:hypothetical protein
VKLSVSVGTPRKRFGALARQQYSARRCLRRSSTVQLLHRLIPFKLAGDLHSRLHRYCVGHVDNYRWCQPIQFQCVGFRFFSVYLVVRDVLFGQHPLLTWRHKVASLTQKDRLFFWKERLWTEHAAALAIGFLSDRCPTTHPVVRTRRLAVFDRLVLLSMSRSRM